MGANVNRPSVVVLMLMMGIWCVPMRVFVSFMGVEMAVFVIVWVGVVMTVGVMPIVMIMAMGMGQRFMPMGMLVVVNCGKIGAQQHDGQRDYK